MRIEKRKVIVAYEQHEEAEYEIPSNTRLIIQSGDDIEPGQQLTEGSLNPHSILRIQGRDACRLYLLSEVQQVYRLQGQIIHYKPFDVTIRNRLSIVELTEIGHPNFIPG